MGVISAIGEEVGQHVIAVAGAQQTGDGQSHAHGVVARQNVAEVAGGHHKVDGLAHADGVLLHQLSIGVEIIDDLRGKTAEVDGIGRAGQLAHGVHLLPEFRAGEQTLHAGLRVVKIALHADDVGIAAAGGGHLQFLHTAYAAVGVKYRAAGAGHVLEAFQRGLAGIAAGSHQNADLPFLIVLLRSQTNQVGQQIQRHILKGQRGTVEQLQHVHVRHQGMQRRDGGVVKMLVVIGCVDRLLDLGNGIVLQIIPKDPRRLLLIAGPAQGSHAFAGKLGEHAGHI